MSLNEFLRRVSQEKEEREETTLKNEPGKNPNQEPVSQKWVTETLAYETRRAIRRKKQAETDKEKLSKEALGFRIRQLKATPNSIYGDQFNRLVCTKLDQLEMGGVEFPLDQNRFGLAEAAIKEEIRTKIDDQAIIELLSQKLITQRKRKLQALIDRGLKQLADPEKALVFAAIMFEIEERKTEDIWQTRKLEKAITAGLNKEGINLITMLCCINEYDYEGSYAVIPNLCAYQRNPKLEPIPLIVDELIATRQFFEFYGIRTGLTIYVSDTEYTEVDKFGSITPETLEALRNYVSNLQTYTAERDQETIVTPISSLTKNNPLYEDVKKRVLEQVTRWNDLEFTGRWYQKFERYLEEMCERIAKRKIFVAEETRPRSLDITRRRWAVNAAEGAIFGNLNPNTILISTEQRKRDQTYVLDETAKANFPPVIYILRAAERWNKKLLGKADY